MTSGKGEHERGTPGLPLQPCSWDVPNKVPAHPVCTVPSLIPVSRRKCCVTSVRKVAKVTVVTRHYENGFVTNITSTPAQSEVQTTSFKIGQSKSYR